MDVSLYSSAAAMNATERWQDMIAQNLTSSSVPGSRQQAVSFSSVQEGVEGADGTPLVIPSLSSAVNTQQGELQASGNNLDFALEGPGFFTVQLPDGSNAYTRNGEFQLNSQGQMVTKQGYPVVSDSGPIKFDPNNTAPITITADGDVSQGADVKGKMTPVEFNQPQSLTPMAGGLFRNDNPADPPVPGTNTQVRQGFIEGANSSPTLVMASMITAMRLFETNEKVMSMQSDRMTKSITELSGTS
jgi:flagellar basal body rod protein FlgG